MNVSVSCFCGEAPQRRRGRGWRGAVGPAGPGPGPVVRETAEERRCLRASTEHWPGLLEEDRKKQNPLFSLFTWPVLKNWYIFLCPIFKCVLFLHPDMVSTFVSDLYWACQQELFKEGGSNAFVFPNTLACTHEPALSLRWVLSEGLGKKSGGIRRPWAVFTALHQQTYRGRSYHCQWWNRTERKCHGNGCGSPAAASLPLRGGAGPEEMAKGRRRSCCQSTSSSALSSPTEMSVLCFHLILVDPGWKNVRVKHVRVVSNRGTWRSGRTGEGRGKQLAFRTRLPFCGSI